MLAKIAVRGCGRAIGPYVRCLPAVMSLPRGEHCRGCQTHWVKYFPRRFELDKKSLLSCLSATVEGLSGPRRQPSSAIRTGGPESSSRIFFSKKKFPTYRVELSRAFVGL